MTADSLRRFKTFNRFLASNPEFAVRFKGAFLAGSKTDQRALLDEVNEKQWDALAAAGFICKCCAGTFRDPSSRRH